MPSTIDWDAWRARLEQSLGFAASEVPFHDLFAPGGTFTDPANPPTQDIVAIEELTLSFCTDWGQEVTSFRHGDDWAIFEWTGSGSFSGLPDGRAKGIRVSQTGMTLVEVDSVGLITYYRDYLDRKEVFDQVKAALRAESP